MILLGKIHIIGIIIVILIGSIINAIYGLVQYIYEQCDYKACGIISISILFLLLIVQGYLNKSGSAFALTKGEVRRALAISMTIFYMLLIPLILNSKNDGNNIVSQTIDSLHYVIMSIFGFYFGFRVLDNWVRYRILKQIVDEPEILKELQKNDKLSDIIYEILNIKVKK